MASGLYVDDVQAQVRSTALQLLGLCMLLLAALVALGLAITRSVLGQRGGEPARAIEVMSKVAQGNLAVSVPHAGADSLLDCGQDCRGEPAPGSSRPTACRCPSTACRSRSAACRYRPTRCS